jgi:predicted nucleic-acid-binding Zn-ribbon protein
MGLEYSTNHHQCVKCGCTYPSEALKVARRIDDILGINETTFVCIDERVCAKMKLERAELFQRKGVKAFVPTKGVDPIKPLKPVRRTSKTLQFFAPIDSVISRRARKRYIAKLRRKAAALK